MLYNEAYSAVERCDFEKAMELAQRYFSGESTEKPIMEVLSDGANKVIEDIAY